jgi:two-component sensor histidine kinase
LKSRKKGPGIESEIERIGLESERLETLVNDVLGLLRESSEATSRLDEDIDLNHLLSDLVDVVNYEVPQGKPGIDWTPTEPCVLHGDRELLWRAVENVLRNALRHTDPDRGVRLRLEPARKRPDLLITVRDFGGGVPEAELEKIFEPFYRVQESRDAARRHGLGLSIAANAVLRHGGAIRRPTPRGGLMVQISLPGAGAKNASGVKASTASMRSSFRIDISKRSTPAPRRCIPAGHGQRVDQARIGGTALRRRSRATGFRARSGAFPPDRDSCNRSPVPAGQNTSKRSAGGGSPGGSRQRRLLGEVMGTVRHSRHGGCTTSTQVEPLQLVERTAGCRVRGALGEFGFAAMKWVSRGVAGRSR